MLLDLDQGSMTVWKNDEKLGVMQAEGLGGLAVGGCRCVHRVGATAGAVKQMNHYLNRR